jgi:hypothetical protein
MVLPHTLRRHVSLPLGSLSLEFLHPSGLANDKSRESVQRRSANSRDQISEVRALRAERGGQRAEGREQREDRRKQGADGRKQQRAESREQRAEEWKQRAESSEQRAESRA